ncbi:MAG: hypothetical protein K0S07_1698 [Chlamydiales bacterium]|jgi:hypothetical protein|nr:hypothetical protein [Chlamydiales bacterium]
MLATAASAGTWGFDSINNKTFNNKYDGSIVIHKDLRDRLIPLLKIRNVALDILGYIPVISIVSGVCRIALGVFMLKFVNTHGNREAKRGMIIGRFYDEAKTQAICQILRGILEVSTVGIGINIALGCYSTLYRNCNVEIHKEVYTNIMPYNDPDFSVFSKKNWLLLKQAYQLVIKKEIKVLCPLEKSLWTYLKKEASLSELKRLKELAPPIYKPFWIKDMPYERKSLTQETRLPGEDAC